MSVNTFSPVRNLVVNPAMVVRPGNLNVFLGRKKKQLTLLIFCSSGKQEVSKTDAEIKTEIQNYFLPHFSVLYCSRLSRLQIL